MTPAKPKTKAIPLDEETHKIEVTNWSDFLAKGVVPVLTAIGVIIVGIMQISLSVQSASNGRAIDTVKSDVNSMTERDKVKAKTSADEAQDLAVKIAQLQAEKVAALEAAKLAEKTDAQIKELMEIVRSLQPKAPQP